LNSGNALIQHLSEKMRFSRFPVLPGSAQVISGGTVKRLLIAYFIGNISVKKYQNAFTYVKVYQRWDVFFETQCSVQHLYHNQQSITTISCNLYVKLSSVCCVQWLLK